MRPAFAFVCASVATVIAVVQMLRFGFGAPMGATAVVMLLVLTVIFLVACAFLHHPTYDAAGPTAALTLTTGIVVALLTFFFVLRWREYPTLPAYIALGAYIFCFTTVGVLLFLWRENGGIWSHADKQYASPPVQPDRFVQNGRRTTGQPSSSRTVEEVVALRRETEVHNSAAETRTGSGPEY
jgi:hypothetical protein